MFTCRVRNCTLSSGKSTNYCSSNGPSTAIASISTRASFGRFPTAKAARAGYGSVKTEEKDAKLADGG